MARILLVWELGGGLGHLANLLPLAKNFSTRGHEVLLVLRDISRAEQLFGDLRVEWIQAPFHAVRGPQEFPTPRTFAHLLHNIGFGYPSTLLATVKAWRKLYALTSPDLVIFDHSPTALLASRGLAIKKAVLGSGFFIPVDEYPLRPLRPTSPQSLLGYQRDEDVVLQYTNRVLASVGASTFERLCEIYCETEETFLITFAELDHYPDRPEANYLGTLPAPTGATPEWPAAGDGERVYAYLKQFPALTNLLDLLRDLGLPAIISTGALSPAQQRRYSSNSLRFSSDQLYLPSVATSASAAIVNGNHFTSAIFLLAGKPTLQIPLHLEQGIFSDCVVRLGAGLRCEAHRPEQIAISLMAMLSDQRFTDAAQTFAAAHANHDPAETCDLIVERCQLLLRTGAAG